MGKSLAASTEIHPVFGGLLAFWFQTPPIRSFRRVSRYHSDDARHVLTTVRVIPSLPA